MRTRSCTRIPAKQILDLYRKYIDQMYPKLPQLFGRLPKRKLEVMPVEEFREKEAPDAEYVHGERRMARGPVTSW
jgi:uncharacterized protein (DUF885 family)